MSLRRYQRAVSNLGGYAGGTSRLARPPAPPLEIDIRPDPESDVCVVTIHAAATGNTYSPPRALVALDEAGMSNPCELDAHIESPAAVLGVLLIPPGDYSGVTAHVVWGDGASAECYLAVEDSASVTIADDIVTAGTPVDLSVGAFTVPSPNGRVYVLADFTVAGGSHTIDPSTVITITKTA